MPSINMQVDAPDGWTPAGLKRLIEQLFNKQNTLSYSWLASPAEPQPTLQCPPLTDSTSMGMRKHCDELQKELTRWKRKWEATDQARINLGNKLADVSVEKITRSNIQQILKEEWKKMSTPAPSPHFSDVITVEDRAKKLVDHEERIEALAQQLTSLNQKIDDVAEGEITLKENSDTEYLMRAEGRIRQLEATVAQQQEEIDLPRPTPEQFIDLQAAIIKRFDKVDATVAQLQTEDKKTVSILNNMVKLYDTMSNNLTELKEKVQRLEGELSKMDGNESKINILLTEFSNFKKELDSLKCCGTCGKHFTPNFSCDGCAENYCENWERRA